MTPTEPIEVPADLVDTSAIDPVPETPKIPEYVHEGNELVPGTRVHATVDHHPDTPPPIGYVIGHETTVYPSAERRHVVRLDTGFVMSYDFEQLEVVDQKRINEINLANQDRRMEVEAQRLIDEAAAAEAEAADANQ